MNYKYIVHVAVSGFVTVLVIYSTSCTLQSDQILKIIRRDYNPACTMLSYKVEPQKLPENYSMQPLNINIINGTAASNVSASPSPEA